MLFRVTMFIVLLTMSVMPVAFADGPPQVPQAPQTPEQAALNTLRQQRDQARQAVDDMQINLAYLQAQMADTKNVIAYYESWVKGDIEKTAAIATK